MKFSKIENFEDYEIKHLAIENSYACANSSESKMLFTISSIATVHGYQDI